MAKMVEMDYNVKFSSQLEEDVGPIVFVNKFTVNREDFDEFLKNSKSRGCVKLSNDNSQGLIILILCCNV